jgi:stearoyl-CoA desaturase (delta-9 desaturase)
LKALSGLGLVWDLNMPPKTVLRNEQRLGSRVIDRAAAQLAASFNPDLIATAVASALGGPSQSALHERLESAQHRAADVLANLHLPQLPTRAEILATATAMFAWTPSMEDIVDRAHALILDTIGTRLTAGGVQVAP